MTFDDYHLILNIINDLFIHTDQRNWEMVERCFADEVHFDMTSLAGGESKTLSPKQITSGWDTGLREVTAIHHQTGNFRVDVTGDKATVFCYGTAYNYLTGKSGNHVRMFVGSYDFELIKHEASWKINLFRFNSKFTHEPDSLGQLVQKTINKFTTSSKFEEFSRKFDQFTNPGPYRLESLRPMLETHDFPATLKFYTETLGFRQTAYHEDIWANLERDGAKIMFSAPNEHRNMSQAIMSGSLYIRTNNVNAVWQELKDKVKVCYPIENFPYGMREFGIYDNNGYLLQFGQDIESVKS